MECILKSFLSQKKVFQLKRGASCWVVHEKWAKPMENTEVKVGPSAIWHPLTHHLTLHNQSHQIPHPLWSTFQILFIGEPIAPEKDFRLQPSQPLSVLLSLSLSLCDTLSFLHLSLSLSLHLQLSCFYGQRMGSHP